VPSLAQVGPQMPDSREREFFFDNLLVRIRFIIVMMRWTGLAPWEFAFTVPVGPQMPDSNPSLTLDPEPGARNPNPQP